MEPVDVKSHIVYRLTRTVNWRSPKMLNREFNRIWFSHHQSVWRSVFWETEAPWMR